MKKIFLSLLVLVLLPLSVIAQPKDDIPVTGYNLTGAYDGGGGIYYIRQIDNQILWYGEENATSPSWSNVAYGTIVGDKVNVIWADVPKGTIMQHGTLVLKIISDNKLELESNTGDPFATPVWERRP
jgi:hypothetical protein